MWKAVRQQARKIRLSWLKFRYAGQNHVCDAIAKKWGTEHPAYGRAYVKGLNIFWHMTDLKALIDAGTAERFIKQNEERKAALKELVTTLDRRN